ncbi:hypothetical protein PoB_000584900 [Plakobranchus ocellatus]|uniref:Uncharacterized protein n=1 Tax=Plakobranchus ocellatus TaxID=259542 RepID=A0AAV3YB76_9GAST|nr:hypothetical protein PoB_000584900 [Plakobranchus ocellatus]
MDTNQANPKETVSNGDVVFETNTKNIFYCKEIQYRNKLREADTQATSEICWVAYIMRREGFKHLITTGMLEGKKTWGRQRYTWAQTGS